MNEPEIGTKIDDKFTLLALIGRGASGSVYKAQHVFLEEEVAVKFFTKQVTDGPESEERFKQEATLLSNFSHPNIVKFHSFGRSEGKDFMVLEYIEGETLSSLLRKEGPLKEERALPIFLAICHGLDYVHKKGVIHRDIKPSNVMITDSQDEAGIKLLDFGILKLLNSDQKLTRTGVIVGSSNYMSPEQCKSTAIDQRSDFYSLGCLMYEVLSGSPPMEADSDLLIMNNHLAKEIKSVPARYGISAEMERVILRCLQKDPGSRYANAEALTNALEAARDKPLQRRKNRQLGIAGAAVAAALLVAGGLFFGFRAIQKNNNNTAARQISEHLRKDYRLAEPPDISRNLPLNMQQLSDWLSDKRHANADENVRIKTQVFLGQVRNRLGLPQVPADFMDERQIKKYTGNDVLKEQAKALFDFRQYVAIKHYLLGLAEDAEDDGDFSAMHKTEEEIDELPALVEEFKIATRAALSLQSQRNQAMANLRMAEIECWIGAYTDAIRHCLKASELVKNQGLDSIRTDALLRMALCQYMQGRQDESRQTIRQEFALATKMLDTYNTITLGDEFLELANELGLSSDVIKFMDNPYFGDWRNERENHVRRMIRMQLELARACLLNNKSADCFKTLEEILDYCKKNLSHAETRDRAECLYLRALHVEKRDAEIPSHASTYFAELKKANQLRALESAPLLISELSKIGQSTDFFESLIEPDLQSFESKDLLPPVCIDIRLASGAAALARKDFTAALRYYEKAEADCQDRNTLQIRYLKALAIAKQQEAKIGLHAYGDVHALHDKINELDKKDPNFPELAMARPISFLGKHLVLRAKLMNNDVQKRPAQFSHQLTKLMKNHKKTEISIIDDYASCARTLAEFHDKTGNCDKALSTLSEAVEKLKQYQGWRTTNRYELLKYKLELLEKELANGSSPKLSSELEKTKKELGAIPAPGSITSLINDGVVEPLPWLRPSTSSLN